MYLLSYPLVSPHLVMLSPNCWDLWINIGGQRPTGIALPGWWYSSSERWAEPSPQVREDLVRAGLVEHTTKCSWVPSHQAKWLWFKLNLQQGVTSMPEEKITALRSQLSKVAANSALKAKELPIPKLKDECIRWFSDNQNVVRIMDNGSKKARAARGGLCNILNCCSEPHKDRTTVDTMFRKPAGRLLKSIFIFKIAYK